MHGKKSKTGGGDTHATQASASKSKNGNASQQAPQTKDAPQQQQQQQMEMVTKVPSNSQQEPKANKLWAF